MPLSHPPPEAHTVCCLGALVPHPPLQNSLPIPPSLPPSLQFTHLSSSRMDTTRLAPIILPSPPASAQTKHHPQAHSFRPLTLSATTRPEPLSLRFSSSVCVYVCVYVCMCAQNCECVRACVYVCVFACRARHVDCVYSNL